MQQTQTVQVVIQRISQQQVCHAGQLQVRNEIRRGDHPPLRMRPAYQRFHVRDAILPVQNWLVIEIYLVFYYGFLDLPQLLKCAMVRNVLIITIIDTVEAFGFLQCKVTLLQQSLCILSIGWEGALASDKIDKNRDVVEINDLPRCGA